jgi:beta-lactamase superfamily II metal-dependent hydrolase
MTTLDFCTDYWKSLSHAIFGGGHVLTANGDEVDFDAFLQTVEQRGWTRYDGWEELGNRFATYCSGGEALHVSYFSYRKMIRVVMETGSPCLQPRREDQKMPFTVKPLVTQVKLAYCKADCGMSYVIRLSDGRFVIIDGGYDEYEEAERLYDILMAQNMLEKITVAAWIITHPHGDHYFALRELAKTPACISVKTLMYHFPAEFRDRKGNGCPAAIRDMESIAAALGAEIRLPQVDEHIDVDGMDIHVLYTPTDCSILNNPNQLSLIFTVQGPQKKLMVTGDAYSRNMQIAVWRYDKALKADILQLPHHGLCDTGNMDFYKRVDAETVLVPISRAGDRTMASDMYGDAPKINRFAQENAKTVLKAFEGTTEMEL